MYYYFGPIGNYFIYVFELSKAAWIRGLEACASNCNVCTPHVRGKNKWISTNLDKSMDNKRFGSCSQPPRVDSDAFCNTSNWTCRLKIRNPNPARACHESSVNSTSIACWCTPVCINVFVAVGSRLCSCTCLNCANRLLADVDLNTPRSNSSLLLCKPMRLQLGVRSQSLCQFWWFSLRHLWASGLNNAIAC